MNRIEANAFATNWIRAWNKKDVDAVLEHYVEDAKFISPKAARFVGNPVIEGKKALSEYWHLAAKKIEKIEFKLDHIVWDSDSNDLIIFYEANLNGVCNRACEAMKFDSSGRQVSGSDVWGSNLVASPEHPYVRFGSCVDGAWQELLRRCCSIGRVRSCVRPHMMVSPSSAELGRPRSKAGLSSLQAFPANLTSGGS